LVALLKCTRQLRAGPPILRQVPPKLKEYYLRQLDPDFAETAGDEAFSLPLPYGQCESGNPLE
jgi:hypothetical protein